MQKRRLIQGVALMFLALLPAGLTGCAVLAVGAVVGTVAYLEGELVGYVSADIYETVDATNLAADTLALRPVSRSGDQFKAVMVADDAEGNRITIRLLPETPTVTKVKIRVGSIGEQAYSRHIFEEIESHLPRRR